MNIIKFLTTATIIFISFLPLAAKADGNVSVSVNQFTNTLQLYGDGKDNSLHITMGAKKTLLITGRNGTKVNGSLNRLAFTQYYEDVSIFLEDGYDELEIDRVDLRHNRLIVEQRLGDSMINIHHCRLGNSTILSGGGADRVTLNHVEAKLIRVADADGAFPLNFALPGTNSSIFTEDTLIECLDLQARTVEVDDHYGALLVATTYGKIENVDASTGDANLGFMQNGWIGVENAAVAIAAEYDSPASNVDVNNIKANEVAVLYYDSLLNDRTNSRDRISIDKIQTEVFSVGTGFDRDEVSIRNVFAKDEVILDFGSQSDELNTDGTNTVDIYNLYALDDVEIVGGSGRDEISLEYLYSAEALTLDTRQGSDQVRSYYSYVDYESEILLGSGYDRLVSYGTYFGALYLDGGSDKDTAFQWYSSWIPGEVENLEQHNFSN